MFIMVSYRLSLISPAWRGAAHTARPIGRQRQRPGLSSFERGNHIMVIIVIVIMIMMII